MKSIVDTKRNLWRLIIPVIGMMFMVCMFGVKAEAAKTYKNFNAVKKEYRDNKYGLNYCYWYNIKLKSGSKTKTMRAVVVTAGNSLSATTIFEPAGGKKFKKVIACGGNIISYGSGRKYFLAHSRAGGMSGTYTVYKYNTKKKKYKVLASEDYNYHSDRRSEEDILIDLSDKAGVDVTKFKSFGSKKTHEIFNNRSY